MDLALNNLQRLIYHEIWENRLVRWLVGQLQPTNQPKKSGDTGKLLRNLNIISVESSVVLGVEYEYESQVREAEQKFCNE